MNAAFLLITWCLLNPQTSSAERPRSESAGRSPLDLQPDRAGDCRQLGLAAIMEVITIIHTLARVTVTSRTMVHNLKKSAVRRADPGRTLAQKCDVM